MKCQESVRSNIPFAFRRSLHLIVSLLILLNIPPISINAKSNSPSADVAWEASSGAAEDTLPASVSADWWTAVQGNILHSEYNVTWQDETYLPGVVAAYHAPNRAHNLRTYFTDDGPVVIPRDEVEPSWRWGMSPVGYGYDGDVLPVPAPYLYVSENRVEYRRGDLVEWYLNDERGLEQGFTLEERPGGTPIGMDESIVLELAVTGDLTPDLADGGTIEFATSGGVHVLDYGELHAFDAAGRELDAHFELEDAESLRIVVDAAGAAYPITVDPLTTSPVWTAEGEQADAYFGQSVNTAGDVNGDGYSDVIVGARGYDNGELNEGRVYVYYGSASGLSTNADWTAESNQSGQLGRSVSTAGDVNGDGYSDIIVGAYQYSNGQTGEGAAFIWYGSASGLGPDGTPANADWMAESDQANARLGRSVSTAGDVNGDGYSDVIAGAYYYNGGTSYEGRAFVWYGSASGPNTTPDWYAESNQWDAELGISVDTAGDVNGDGYSDVIVGAFQYDNGQGDEGIALIWYGSATGLGDNGTPANADWMAEGDNSTGRFGGFVGTAGDVNGDGYTDVIVGAYEYDNGETNEGAAFVYYGSASGPSTTADWMIEGNQPGARLGVSVNTAGDVNGDGYADVIVGADMNDSSEIDGGHAYVYYGSAFGLNITPDWVVGNEQDRALFGQPVSTAGDVNGDGYSDVIIGTPWYDDGETDEGRAYVYHGNGGDGLDVVPCQVCTDGSVHIAPLGLSDSKAEVQLCLTGRMPLGREKVKLQWQVAPLDVPFTSPTGVISGTSVSWTDTYTTGAEIIQNVTGLAVGTPYHWRIRLLYHPGNRMGQPASCWIYVPWNGWTEQCFCTEPPDVSFEAPGYDVDEEGGSTIITATLDIATGWD